VNLDLEQLGVTASESFEVYDLLANHPYKWQGPRNYIALRPYEMPAHVFRVEPLR
jgi:starch synthase (maltosyl-transferring)